jgi:hypothetical protein
MPSDPLLQQVQLLLPMNEFVVNGDLPDCHHEDGVAGHVRVFSGASFVAVTKPGA